MKENFGLQFLHDKNPKLHTSKGSELHSAEDLVLPETLNGDLDLSGLLSAEDLVLPETLNGNLNLSSLTSAEGLVLPETLNGNLDLRGLNNLEKEKLRQKYPQYADKIK